MDNKKDIESLIEIAKSQNYKINLSMVLISLKIKTEEIPDIIEIFGSELPFALIASETKVPVVLHIQGVLVP